MFLFNVIFKMTFWTRQRRFFVFFKSLIYGNSKPASTNLLSSCRSWALIPKLTNHWARSVDRKIKRKRKKKLIDIFGCVIIEGQTRVQSGVQRIALRKNGSIIKYKKSTNFVVLLRTFHMDCVRIIKNTTELKHCSWVLGAEQEKLKSNFRTFVKVEIIATYIILLVFYKVRNR